VPQFSVTSNLRSTESVCPVAAKAETLKKKVATSPTTVGDEVNVSPARTTKEGHATIDEYVASVKHTVV